MQPEVLSEHRCLLGEGPAWDVRDGRLIFVDILLGHVHGFDPHSGELMTVDVGGPVGAAVPRTNGGFLLATDSGFAALADDGRLEPLHRIDSEGEPGTRMNDGKCDPAGRFWAGTQSDNPERGRGWLYRFGLDGVATRMLGGVGISNGLDWSADGETMYYADTATGGVDVFRFDVESGTLCDRRRFVDVAPENGLPDGLTIDAEGGLWLALFAGARLHRYSPEGELDAVVEFPVSLVTSCAFGGDDLDELYVTSAAHVLREPEPLAGALFRLHPGVRGRPCTAFAG